MSTTIDERVVEMRFDNKHFESNVATSMSTLDKLKQKLNLSGASKGLEDINAASRKVDMSGLGRSVESVSAKFSALQVMGVTALANITNQAVNASKRMASALTIDPIKTGFQEYETQINSVQTILANTSSKGTTITDVTKALDELNRYADMTIYNFTEMTRNIGTFTAAGVDLDTSVNAIQGIANLAAVSGSTSQQASTAMYQLSQALAAGTVKLMDWNSVVNAGMGGEVFQNALKETSRLLGTGADEAIKATGSFRESLREEWLTAEVLTETLKKFTSSGAVEYIAEYTGESQEAVNAILEETDAWGNDADAIDKAAEALAKKSGKNKDEIKSALEMAKNAQDAATKVKTFSQLWDVMKEAAQSGWAKTWQIIIGDFEEAKSLLTPLADMLTGFINRMSDARNRVLEIALNFSKPWTTMMDKLGKVKQVANNIEKVTDKLEYFQKVVDKVWRGDYKNSDTGRYELLEKAGYDHRVVQDLVNKGYQYKLTVEDIEASHKKFGLTMETTTEEAKKTTVAFEDLTDKKLKDAGLTEDEIALYRAMQKEADRLGISVSDLADEMSKNDGRTMLIESFKNFGDIFVGIGKAAKEAWVQVFNPPGTEEIAIRLYGMIKSLRDFSETLRLTDKETGKLTDTGEKIQRTFKGVFAILDVVTTILGGGFKIAFKVISQLLGYFNLDILDVTASVGDALVAFNKWFDSIFDITGVLDAVVPLIHDIVDAVKEWFAAFKETPAVQKLVEAMEAIGDTFNKLTSGEIDVNEFASSLGENLGKALKSLPEIAVQIGKDFIAGFQNGIEFSISDIIDNIIDFCINFVSSFAEALGVESPSWKAYDTATDFFQGFINGVRDMLEPVISILKGIGEKIIDVFKSLWDYITDENGDVEWGKLFAGGSIVAMLWFLKQLATAFSGIAEAFGGIGDLLQNAGKVMKSFSKVLNGVAFDLKAKAILKIAIALAIVMAAFAVVALLTKDIDKGTLWNTVGIIAALAVILVGLAWAMGQLSTASVELDGKAKTLKASGMQKSLISIGLTILALAFAVKMIGEMRPEEAERGLLALAGVAGGLIVFLAAMGGISRYAKDAQNLGSMMLKLSIGMGIMAYVMNAIGKMDPENIAIGLAVMEVFVLLIAQLGIANRIAGSADGFGGNVLKISFAMLLMVGVCKLAGMLTVDEMFKGAAFMFAFGLFVGMLVGLTKIDNEQQLAKAGGLVLSVSTSLLLMVGVCKLVGMLSAEEMIKGGLFVAAFVVLLKYLVDILKIGKEDTIAKVTGTILAMSTAIAILAAVAVLLSFVSLEGLAKGITAVGLLSIMMVAMIKALKGAQNAKGAIMMMAISIGVMAAAVAALSFIPTEDLAAATVAMVALMAAFALMVKQLKGLKSFKGFDDYAPFIAMAAIVGILAGIVVALSFVDAENAVPNALAIGILLSSMAASFRLLNGVKIDKSISNSLLIMSACLGIVAVILGIMSALNIQVSIPNAIALGILINALSASLLIASLAGPFASKAATAMLTMSLALAAVGLVLGVMAAFNIEPSIETALSLSVLMLALSAACLLVSMIPVSGAITGALGLAAFIGIMAAVVAAAGGLSKIPGFNELLADGGTALSLIGKAIGGFVGGIIAGIAGGVLSIIPQLGVALSAFAVGVVPFVALISNIDASAIAGAGYLTAAILALTAATFISGVTSILTLGQSSLATLGLQLYIFGTYAKQFYDAISGVDATAVEAATNTADMILALTASNLISTITEKFGGSVDFSTMGANLKTFGEAVVGFSDTISGKIDVAAVEAATNAGLLLVELNKSLPRSGGWIQDIIGEKDFGAFAAACKAFCNVILEVNEYLSQEGFEIQSEKIEQIVVAGEAFNRLNTALPRTGGIAQDLAGEQDLAGFGTACKAFAACMIEINNAISGEDFVIQSERIDQLVTAGEAFNRLNTALPKTGGIAQDLAGEQDLSAFGKACAAFADCMITVNEAVSQEGFAVNLEAIDGLKEAGLKMDELQDALPKSGGWWEEIAGSQDIGDFGEKIKTFADAIANFSTASTGLDATAIDTCLTYVDRIKTLMTGLIGVDYSGVDAFTGIGSGGVGADGPAYDIAAAMAKFSTKVSEIDTAAVSVAVSSAVTLKNLIAGLVGLDTSGIENFKPGTIGDQMKSFADKVAGIDTSLVSSSISSANRLTSFIASLVNLDTSGISNFKVNSIGTSLKDYAASVSKFNSGAVSDSITTANQLKNFISSLASLDTSGVGSFAKAIEKLGTVDVGKVIEAFSGATTKFSSAGADLIKGLVNGMEAESTSLTSAANKLVTDAEEKIRSKDAAFSKAGTHLVNKFKDGISEGSSKATSEAKTMAGDAAEATRGKYDAFYNAGSYLVTGFKNGISENSYKAAAKAKAMAEAAVEAAKEELKINSPSKVFKAIGSGIPEGFAMGIGMLGNTVTKSVVDMTSGAIDSTRSAMTSILEAVNSDIDVQPTIRPVLDLSDVKSGAGAINGLLGSGSVGVMANLGSINSMMNRRSQNGTEDVISAINHLRKDLGKTGNTYNSINGITYDDGSAVSDAVKVLVRAAKVERRV